MIRTSRLLLREASAEDEADLHAIFSDPRAMRYWSTLPHTDIVQTRAFLTGMMASDLNGICDFVVEHQGRIIGKAGCWHAPEIGFIFHPDVWGQGFATEALNAAIPEAFSMLPIDHLMADVDPDNTASLKLLHRLGFVEVGREKNTLQIGDQWFDSVYLKLARATATSVS